MRRLLILSGGSAAIVLTAGALMLFGACSSDPTPPSTTVDSSSSGFEDVLLDTASSGSSGADTSSSGGVGSDCGIYATVTCGYLFACSPIQAGTTYADVTTCQQRVAQECARVDKMAGVGALPSACTTAAATRPLSCTTPALPPECNVKGKLANGIVCENDRQCESGYCKGALPCGRCDTAVAENGSCESLDCIAGLLCLEKICKAKLPKDSACGPGECAVPNKCVGAKCIVPLQVGSPCGTDGADDEDPCDATKALRCTNGTCDFVTIAANGADCGFVGSAFVVCNGGAECVNKKCVAKPADNAPCPETGPQCNWGAVCTNGTCTLPASDRCK